ncbi:MutS-related protein [Halomarina oriensis]|uniref:DNA mismatch repair protein n=1 Tax=Halomarina oriensis TaxID=671145 RepID=A0A6B0GDD7_9EURY|nr:DNA mismatch repair protein [Halomarina oriensis]MWG32926.1 DNA mismatch repair protein [Halomarina oriensis]
MRLEDYWGVGPKTAALLREELGEERAIEAIEAADGRTLVAAGLPSGRATRILRRVQGGDGMDLLATRDARSVYRDLVSLAKSYAVTGYAADRIRVLTPLRDRDAIEERLSEVTEAVDSWQALDDETREAVVAAFEAHDDRAGTAAAVETALALRETGVAAGVFAPLADLDADTLRESAVALRALEAEGVGEGADEELDRLREALGEVEDMTADAGSVAEFVQSSARDASDFRDALLREVTGTSVEREAVRDAMPDEAIDTTAFVTETLRTLSADLREQVHDRERAVRESLEADVEAGREAVDAAVETVDDVALQVSLARFAVAFDLHPPTLVEGDALAMRGARNLDLVAADVSVQPVDYAVGDHSLGGEAPSGDRVAVLTGANSGGKTTLLETLSQVALLAHMGLPVPAEECEVGLVDSLVFHRRHASFNAGVLESTLRSVVPPLTTEGRTLMLVDEFEAITEPGSAADLLHGLVTLTVERDALGAYVTHLAEDLEPLPEVARVDGIFAEGLTPDLELEVDYQPRFGTVGRSTPEFIVSRLVAEASDTNERMGFETLAASVGQEVVQRTLADVRWSAEESD